MSDEEIKIPRRRRWGRKVLLILLLLLIAALIAPPIFSHRSDREIQVRIARYRSAGEPVNAADLGTPSVPEEENAVVDLREAAVALDANLRASNDWKTWSEFDHTPPLTGKEQKLAATIVQNNTAVLSLLDSAMTKERFYWPSQPTSPLISWLLPDLSPQRGLAQFLALAAVEDHHHDDQAAVLDIRRVLFLARAMDHHPMCMVVALVATGMRAIATDALFKIGPDLKIGDAAGCASPKQIAQLITELLDDVEPDQAVRMGVLGERAGQLDTGEQMLQGNFPFAAIAGGGTPPGIVFAFSGPGRYFTGPMLRRDLLYMLDVSTTAADVFRLPDWPAASLPTLHASDPIRAAPLEHVWASIMLPSFDRYIETHFRCRAERRLAAVMLAMRWYAADHQGQLPPTLATLVPQYLPSIPIDPFFAGGKAPLRYFAGGPDPRIYSVAKNGVDDDASDSPLRPGKTNSSRWDKLDAVVHLHPQPRDLSYLPDSMKD